MKKTQNSLKEHTESKFIKTKADKIIFTASVIAYTIVMILEVKFTPHHNSVSSAIAAFGISIFLISKAIYIGKNQEIIFAKDKLKWLLMLIISAVLTIFAVYWLVKEFII